MYGIIVPRVTSYMFIHKLCLPPLYIPPLSFPCPPSPPPLYLYTSFTLSLYFQSIGGEDIQLD